MVLFAGLGKTKAMSTQPIAFLISLQHPPDIFKFLVMDKVELDPLVPVQKNRLHQHCHIFSQKSCLARIRRKQLCPLTFKNCPILNLLNFLPDFLFPLSQCIQFVLKAAAQFVRFLRCDHAVRCIWLQTGNQKLLSCRRLLSRVKKI